MEPNQGMEWQRYVELAERGVFAPSDLSTDTSGIHVVEHTLVPERNAFVIDYLSKREPTLGEWANERSF